MYTIQNPNVNAICERYNTMVSCMVENSKRINTEQTRAYHAAFQGKNSIEKTVKWLGYHLEFDECGNAVNVIANGD